LTDEAGAAQSSTGGRLDGASTGDGRGFARALWPGLWLSGLLAVLAFVLSFSALSAVGVASGIEARLGWAFPLIIDGFILLATWAAWRFRTQGLRGAWYPWAAFVVFSAVSMAGNALHAHPVQVGELMLARWAATAFSTVPSIALLVASHMLLMIATARTRMPRTDAGAAPADPSSGTADDAQAGGQTPHPRADAQAAHDSRQAKPAAAARSNPSDRPSPDGSLGLAAAKSAVSVQREMPVLSAGWREGVPAGAGAVQRHLSVVAELEGSEPLLVPASRTALARVEVPAAVVTEDQVDPADPVARWVGERVRAGLTVTGPDLVAAGLASSASTARRWLRELRSSRPELFTPA
jgi:hypothetical protein